jgi:hypothetical protein
MQNVKKLAIFGQAGSGKTSLCNTLFGLNWKTDPAVDCTKSICQHEGSFVPFLNGGQLPSWKLHDTPGVGASEDIQQDRLQILSDTFHQVNVIIWVIQADTRALRVDQETILELTNHGQKIPEAHLVLAINQIDRVYPEDWDEINNIPSPEQQKIITEKISLAHKRFAPYLPILIEHIVPCSTVKKYGLEQLVNLIHKPFYK